MVRHCDDPMRSIGRPTHPPPQATAMAGANALGCARSAGRHRRRESSTRQRVTCGRMARLTHEPTGSLDVGEGIRLGVRVTLAF